MPGRQPFFIGYFRTICLAGLLLFAGSCTIVKNYPQNKPFVYKTNINIKGNIASDTALLLESRLKGQLDDSMRARSVSKILWSVMKNPPVYNADNAEKSVTYMKALLRSMGYTRDTITFDTTVTHSGDKLQTTVDFNVNPGIVIRIDSFAYNFKDQEMQAIAVDNQSDALVKEGDAFAKATISAEFDRLVNLYRTKGYLRFGREEMIGLWDTLNLAIINPSLDPFEQILLLDSIKRSRNEPRASLEIRFKPNYDSSKLIKYYIGNITVYPDFRQDSLDYKRREETIEGIRIISNQPIFKAKIFPENIFFRRGELYNQNQYQKTIQRLNTLGSWRYINLEPVPRKNQDTADFILRMTPTKKYSFTANIEGSRNQSAVSGNLFGIALNIGLQNRNFARAANISNSNLRIGIEVGDTSLRQTQQIVFTQNIYFPRLIPNFRWIPERYKEKVRTILNFNAAITQRLDLFNLTTVNGSWGYELQSPKATITLRWPNIEYSTLNPKEKLLLLIAANPSLGNIFTDGLILSALGGITFRETHDKWEQFVRYNTELSGVVGVLRGNFFDDNLYRFWKNDVEFVHKRIIRRTALVGRIFFGLGWEFNNTRNPGKSKTLPFFKEYFAGGPNSMRAWGLRKLGRGTMLENFSGMGSSPERYGDVQLETNLEYRFPAFTLKGVIVNGALFTDIGNIWFLKDIASTEKREIFRINRLFTDLAVGIGTGLRIDFGFFVVRLDYSYKAKDPSPSSDNQLLQNKWFGYKLRAGDQFQLGLSYPFIL